MIHLAPTHFAQTKRDGLSFQQWTDAYVSERVRLGLSAEVGAFIAGERFDLNETPRDMAECDLAKAQRLAEGWGE